MILGDMQLAFAVEAVFPCSGCTWPGAMERVIIQRSIPKHREDKTSPIALKKGFPLM